MIFLPILQINLDIRIINFQPFLSIVGEVVGSESGIRIAENDGVIQCLYIGEITGCDCSQSAGDNKTEGY